MATKHINLPPTKQVNKNKLLSIALIMILSLCLLVALTIEHLFSVFSHINKYVLLTSLIFNIYVIFTMFYQNRGTKC